MKLKITLTFILLFFLTDGRTQPGTLDSDFSGDGKLNIAFNSSTNNIANAIVIQPNQKIVVAGTFFNGLKFNAAVARINEDGTMDASFGTGGKFVTAFTTGHAKINAMALQSDGKIVLAGSWFGLLAQETFLVARLLPDGTLDSTFGGDGIVTTVTGTRGAAYSVAIQSDSLIIAGGYSKNASETYVDFTLVRYKPNGSIDSSFNLDGIVKTDFFGYDDKINALVITKSNKILAAGYASFMGGTENRFALAKYNINGALDINFSSNGKADYAFDTYDDKAYAILIQPDDKIILGGHGVTAAVLMRVNSGGELDSTFSDDGRKHFWWGAGDNEIHGMALQPDGKILTAGFCQPSQSAFSVARITQDGIVDSSFGTNGMNTSTFQLLRSKAHCMALQKDGRIVVAGTSRSSTFVTDTVFAVVRYYTGLNLGVLNFSAEQKSVTAYPNPVSDFINLKYMLTQSEMISIRLFDMQGRLITTFLENEKQEQGSVEHKFLLPQNIRSGNYLLNLVSEKGSVSIQITRQ